MKTEINIKEYELLLQPVLAKHKSEVDFLEKRLSMCHRMLKELSLVHKWEASTPESFYEEVKNEKNLKI